MYDIIDAIMDYESGTLTEEEIIEFLQKPIDRDILRKLQGHYGRTADTFIKVGHYTCRN